MLTATPVNRSVHFCTPRMSRWQLACQARPRQVSCVFQVTRWRMRGQVEWRSWRSRRPSRRSVCRPKRRSSIRLSVASLLAISRHVKSLILLALLTTSCPTRLNYFTRLLDQSRHHRLYIFCFCSRKTAKRFAIPLLQHAFLRGVCRKL